MLSSQNIHESEWLDFVNGHHLDFNEINREDAMELAGILHGPSPYDKLFTYFNNDYDRLAKAASCAFQANRITREQVSTMLELRTIKINPAFTLQIIPLLDDNNQFTPACQELLPVFLNSQERDSFLKSLQSVPASERYFMTVTITGDDILNEGIQGLILIADTRILEARRNISLTKRYIEGAEEFNADIDKGLSQTVTLFCLGAETAMTKAKYGDHAKSIYPVLGILKISDIERSMKRGGRYQSLSYPGIKDETAFHGVDANMFYLTLHDRVHRRLISTISQTSYKAFLHAIDVIRDAAKLTWSHDIWLCIDMEIGIFINENQEKLNDTNLSTINHDFLAMLAAKQHTTNKQLGLFAPSPYVDTTWLLLIDMAFKSDKWGSLSIDPAFFPPHSPYKQMYDFIKLHQQELSKLASPANQVAFIKSKYFDLEYAENKEYKFEKSKKKPAYLELTSDGEPHYISKREYFNLMYRLGASYDISPLVNRPSIDEQPIFTLPQLLRIPCDKIRKIFFSPFESNDQQKNILTLFSNKSLSLDMIRDLPDEAICNIKNPEITNLILEKKLTINDLQYSSICQLITSGKLNLNKLKELPEDVIRNLKDSSISICVIEGLFTIDQLKDFSPDLTEKLKSYGIHSLYRKGKLDIDQIKQLSPEMVKNLNDVDIYSLIGHDLITVDQLTTLTPDVIEKIIKIGQEAIDSGMDYVMAAQWAKKSVNRLLNPSREAVQDKGSPLLTQIPFTHFGSNPPGETTKIAATDPHIKKKF